MPRVTELEKEIPKLYRRSALNMLMFAFVRGARAALHTLTIKDAILMFMEDFELDDDEFNYQTALTTYAQMQKELIKTK